MSGYLRRAPRRIPLAVRVYHHHPQLSWFVMFVLAYAGTSCCYAFATRAIHRHPLNKSNNKSFQQGSYGSQENAAVMKSPGRNTVLYLYSERHRSNDVKVLFSDVDGSLVHYQKESEGQQQESSKPSILSLPPSATGMKGVISAETLARCRDLRELGVKIILVSGMRTSTLLNRLPYLPRADAYCTEAGGRIFYPTKVISYDDDEYDDENPFQQWSPVDFNGARKPEDLKPFGLREDRQWRDLMEQRGAAGIEGYAGNEVFSDRCEGIDDDEECLIDYENPFGFPKQQDVIPIAERKGLLWDFARELQRQGFVLDTKSYSTCFRVNRKHQTDSVVLNKLFQDLIIGRSAHPPGLGRSTNLGCIDFYPAVSGKRNCCKYLADELGLDMSLQSVCICDDDNDIEMAMACARAYIPALSSGSMKAAMQKSPAKFTQTFQEGSVTSTLATDAALQLINDSIR